MINYINVFCFDKTKLIKVVTIPLFLMNVSYVPNNEIWVANNAVTRFDLWLLAKWVSKQQPSLTFNGLTYVFVQGDICTHQGIHEAPPVVQIPYVPWEKLSHQEQEKLQPWISEPHDHKYIRIVEDTFNISLGRVTTESAVFVCDGFYIDIHAARLNGLFV